MAMAPELLVEWVKQIQQLLQLPQLTQDRALVGNDYRKQQMMEMASKNQQLLRWDLFLEEFILNDWRTVQAHYACRFPPKINTIR